MTTQKVGSSGGFAVAPDGPVSGQPLCCSASGPAQLAVGWAAPLGGRQRMLAITGILCRQSPDGGPIEALAALRK